MIKEVRQYLWLRIAILGTGLAIVTSAIAASIQLWPIVHRLLVPTKLACGCAVMSISSPWWLIGLSIVVIVLTATGIGFMAWLFLRRLRASFVQERRLHQHDIAPERDTISGTLIHLVVTDRPFAYTLGFFHPRIFISRGLRQQLTATEYQAVIAHERAHQHAYDPLVTAWLDIVSTIFGWLPGARDWMPAAYSLREVAADAIATDGYRSVEALSSAFVKLSVTTLHPAVSAFSPNRDRLEKLLNHQWVSPRRWWNWSAISIISGIIFATLWFGHTAAAKSPAVPPTAAALCHETIVMCQIERMPVLPSAWLCAGGRCMVPAPSWSSFYARTPTR